VPEISILPGSISALAVTSVNHTFVDSAVGCIESPSVHGPSAGARGHAGEQSARPTEAEWHGGSSADGVDAEREWR